MHRYEKLLVSSEIFCLCHFYAQIELYSLEELQVKKAQILVQVSDKNYSTRWYVMPSKFWRFEWSEKETIAHCLKINQNIAFEFWEFCHFQPIFVLLKLTCLVTMVDRKLQVFKNSPNLPFLAFLINFCPLKM